MATDFLSTTIKTGSGKTFLGGMYYYICNSTELEKVSAITGNCSAVHSCWFSPILNELDVEYKFVSYDIERYGKLAGWSLNYVPELKRITKVQATVKELGEYDKYIPAQIKSSKFWGNESRLYNYPYTFYVLTDHINPPIEIKPHEIMKSKIMIGAKCFISDKGSYSLFIRGLKGDNEGVMEGQTSTATMDIPVGSTAYSQWSSTQKARDNQNYTNSLLNMSLNAQQTQFNNNMGLVQQGVGVIGSLLTGQFGSALSGAVGVYNQYKNNQFGMDRIRLEQQNVIGQRSAQMKDLSNTPRSMLQTGSDINFNLINSNKQISLIRYTITDEYKDRLCDYFTYYGYKQAKVMQVDTRSRHYFNYIKTSNVNILPVGIPKAHLDELRTIYDSGVTIWHVDRENVRMFDYSMDNYEEGRFLDNE